MSASAELKSVLRVYKSRLEEAIKIKDYEKVEMIITSLYADLKL